MIKLTDLLKEVLEENEVDEGFMDYEKNDGKDGDLGRYVRNVARGVIKAPLGIAKNLKQGKHWMTGERKPGSTWETTSGRIGAKNRKHQIRYFKDKESATKFAKS